MVAVDTHHGGHNIQMEDVYRDPRITWRDTAFAGEGEHTRWMPDLDESVDAFLLMGHHAKARTRGAFLPHTWTGDWAEHACAEAQSLVPGSVIAPVKRAESFSEPAPWWPTASPRRCGACGPESAAPTGPSCRWWWP